MPEVLIYTRPWCGYCVRAKGLLEARGVAYREVDLDAGPEYEDEMIERAAGRQTVPQIFIGDLHVGGSDELHALNRSGRLETLLADPSQGA